MSFINQNNYYSTVSVSYIVLIYLIIHVYLLLSYFIQLFLSRFEKKNFYINVCYLCFKKIKISILYLKI